MIVVLGDSHTKAIERCLPRLDEQLRSSLDRKFGGVSAQMILPGFGFHEDFHRVDGGTIHFTGIAREMAAKALGNDGSIRPDDGNVYGFSFGFHAAVMVRDEFWKDYTILPEISGKAYISEGVFRQTVLAENRHILDFARAVKDAGIRCFFICAPPIRQAMLDRQAEIAGPAELIAVRETYRRIMMAEFDAIGLPYILPPEEVAENFVLKSKFDNRGPDDVHHANQRYARLMWGEFLEKVDA